LLKSVLQLFPAHTYHALSAMSEKALVYSQEPLAHRMLVVYEAAGLQGDLATYLIRSLLSEGQVRYETVEKTSRGLVARLIERARVIYRVNDQELIGRITFLFLPT